MHVSILKNFKSMDGVAKKETLSYAAGGNANKKALGRQFGKTN